LCPSRVATISSPTSSRPRLCPIERRRLPIIAAHWREPRALLHDDIKPTPSFTGREAQLAVIMEALWRGGSHAAAITQPAAVTGLGGIGKSTLAREYAWREQARYAGVWWLNAASEKGAESWGEVEQGLATLGDHFVRGLAQAQDRAKAARYALDFLAHAGFAKPWLLIFDNVDQPRVLEAWRPAGNVQVLATSRIDNWSAGIAPVSVEAWGPAEALEYLTRQTGRADLAASDLAHLAETLGRLPLALSHAAAYLRRRKGVSVADYLADLDRHMSEVPSDADYRTPVYATFRAALAQAESDAPGAAALMSLAAFFAPDDIPYELFQQTAALYPPDLADAAEKPARLRELLGVLDDLSLIDLKPDAATFSTHRMVQSTARAALGGERDAWAQGVVAIAFSAFPEPEQDTWPQCARLVAHVRALNAHVQAESATRELGWLLNAAGEYARERAVLADARHFFEASLAIAERLAKADPGNAGWQRDLSVSHEKIGDVLVGQGNLTEGLLAFQASLAIRERLAKADPGNAGWQRDLSVSHNKIGDVLVGQGNLAEGLLAFQASLAIAERLAKADPGNAGWQRDLSVSHNRIGDVLVGQGNLTEGLLAFQASLAIAERLAKADPGNAGWQRDLSVSHEKIGDVLVGQGNLAQGLAAFQASLAIAERLAKADPGNAGWQRDLAVSNERLGDTYSRQDKPKEARQAFERALVVYEALLARNVDDAPSRVNSVVPRWRLSGLDPKNARRHLEAALAILKPLAAEDRLDARRRGWIAEMEEELRAL
jgi:tetratricopeptide (TPR) repeat protein